MFGPRGSRGRRTLLLLLLEYTHTHLTDLSVVEEEEEEEEAFWPFEVFLIRFLLAIAFRSLIFLTAGAHQQPCERRPSILPFYSLLLSIPLGILFNSRGRGRRGKEKKCNSGQKQQQQQPRRRRKEVEKVRCVAKVNDRSPGRPTISKSWSTQRSAVLVVLNSLSLFALTVAMFILGRRRRRRRQIIKMEVVRKKEREREHPANGESLMKFSLSCPRFACALRPPILERERTFLSFFSI